MLKIEYQTQFKRDYKQAVKRGCNIKRLEEVITMPEVENIKIMA